MSLTCSSARTTVDFNAMGCPGKPAPGGDRIDGLAESVEDERGQGVLEALYEWAEQIAPED